jgi:tRNA A-37 threonylcarbamoyl transferase component Bud32
MKNYTQKEVDEKVEKVRTEERFISFIVLSSAGVKLPNQPVQYREARLAVADIVEKSGKYDEITKERFGNYIRMVDNCVPFNERGKANQDAYNAVIKDILAQPTDTKDD